MWAVGCGEKCYRASVFIEVNCSIYCEIDFRANRPALAPQDKLESVSGERAVWVCLLDLLLLQLDYELVLEDGDEKRKRDS